MINEKGYVICDIKPENIMVKITGDVIAYMVIIDLGSFAKHL